MVKTSRLISTMGLLSTSALAMAVIPQKPNILFILADDLGYGDLACYGQKYIDTPHLDQLAREGVRFTDAYCGSPVSAPSRATIMTGQHSGHTLVRGNQEFWKNVPMVQYGVNQDYSRVGQAPYDPNHQILPEIMKQNGYTTGMFGKWAGGYEGSCSTPDKRGVDEFYGYICQFQAHLYFPNFLNRYSRSMGDTATVRVVLDENIPYRMFGPEYKKRTQYSADLIHQEAMKWLDKQDGKQPFYGFLTYTLPHAELAQPEDSLVSKYRKVFTEDTDWKGDEPSRYNPVKGVRANFAAMVNRLDYFVGEIMAKLKEKGLDENTIVIFSSDNGPHNEGGAVPYFFNSNAGMKGIKRQCYEGGIRVPFIVRWPGHIKAGRVSDFPFAFYDLVPTFCELAGDKNFPSAYLNKEAKSDGYDGISVANEWLGKKQLKKHKHLYWEFHETDEIAVRKGKWKLVVVGGTPHLFDLSKDRDEKNDLSRKYPKLTKQLIDIVYQEHRPNNDFSVTLPKR